MLVGVSITKETGGVPTVLATSNYNGSGNPLTFVGAQSTSDNKGRVEIWKLIAPATGAHTVTINLSATPDGATVGVMTFTGVDQAAPLEAFAAAQSDSGSALVNVSSAAGQLVFAALTVEGSDADLVPDPSQTERWDLFQGGTTNGGGSTKPGAAGTVAMSWTFSSNKWAIGGVSIKPGATYTVSGRVFEDANFAGTASDYDGGASDLGLANVDVELYDAGDAYVASVTSAAGGTFTFSNVGDGTYKIRARSATIGDADTPPKGTLNGTVPGTWPYPLAEMTWGNGAARYGGQSATADDTATADNAGPGDTYVSVTVSGANVTGVNHGFAYNLIVNADDDSNAGNVRSKQGSLRQWIKSANAIGSAGSTTANSSQFRMQVAANQSSGADTWWQIAPAIALPSVADGGTVLDGTTQQANSGADSNTRGPEIELNGNNLGTSVEGLKLVSGSNASTVRGLAINRFTGSGIELNVSSSNSVDGNYVGLNAIGTAAAANAEKGLNLINSSGNTIGGTTAASRNVIAGNTLTGVYLDNADTNTIQGNYIGTTAAGTGDINGTTPNGAQSGIVIVNGSSGNLVGGTNPNARNVLSGNNWYGIEILTATSANNTVQGNYIGTTVGGLVPLPNSAGGASLWGAGTGNLYGGGAANARNVISGNTGPGVLVGSATASGTIQGNYIGLGQDGSTPLGNSGEGVDVQGASTGTLIGTNADGTNDAAERNVISGNGGTGVRLTDAGTNSNSIAGNYIGLTAAGTAMVGNVNDGVFIVNGASSNTVGGATSTHRNVIAGNSDGVQIGGLSGGANNNVVRGNYIGTDHTGTVDLGNNDDGVDIDNAALDSQVIDNLIAGSSGDGIDLGDAGASTGTVIRTNLIGTAANGTSPLGNSGHGILIGNGGTANNTTVGGTTAGQGNTIAHNGGDGVFIPASTGVSVLGNTMFSNTGLGIDLGTNGVTANNGTKNAGLPNFDMDFPVITSAVLSGTTLTVAGYVGLGSSGTFTGVRVEIFKSDNDGSGNGEGQSYYDFLTTDGTSNFSGAITVSGLAAGDKVSATATDAGNNTSEFGPNVAVVGPYSVSGRVFEDANFAGTASDYDGGASDLGLANVDVEIYDSGDTYVTSVATAAGGTFTFNGLGNGTYKIRARAATIGDADTPPKGTLNGTVPGTWPYPLAEMTWANGAALYGGQSATVDDTVTGNNAGPGDTYVTVTVSGANVTGVNSGFAYNLIVNTDDDSNADNVRSKQGSLRQFIKNANAIGTTGSTTANSSQFRMQVAANQSSGADSWWRIAPAIALPSIADAGTTLDGSTQTANGGDSNSRGPEIEINGAGAAGANGMVLSASSATVRGLVVNQFPSSGIQVSGTGALVAGNWIGVDATGTLDRGNANDGVTISANNATIGGPAAADRNVISGNNDEGIDVDPAITGVVIKGNYIGTNAAGSAAVGNGGGGSSQGGILAEGTGTRIGGTAANEWNLISGNQNDGIYLTGTGHIIEANRIGTDFTGTAAMANTGPGITVLPTIDGTNNTIGGATAAHGNTIAFNTGDGVRLAAGAVTGNLIGANSIHSNSGLGIDLGTVGVTVNDGAKTAGQPNLLMDTPVFTYAALSGGTLTVTGYVGSAPGQPTFAGARVEVFESDNDASGYGEGSAYLDFLTADVNGNFSGSMAAAGLAVGEEISGTATDGSNNTSEFGPQFVVTVAAADVSIAKTDSPDPAPSGGPLLYTLLITNNGPGSATSVTVTDTLPASVTLQSATPSQGSCSGTTTVTCNLGAILPTGTASVEILVVTAGPGNIDNNASVTAAESDPVPGNNSASASTQVTNQSTVDVPLTQYRRIHGFVDSTATGGTLRTQPNQGGNPCLVGASSTAALAGIPATATIVNAYLYWAGSGTTVDSQITLDGSSLTADRTWQATFGLGGTSYDFFGGFEDVTAQVTAKRNGNYTFSGLTVATGNPWCTAQSVLAGWSLFAIYEDNSLTGKTLLLYDGFDLTRNGTSNYLLAGIYAAAPPEAKAIFLAWEGDETLSGTTETLRFNGTSLSDGLNPVNNVYNSTINSLGVTTSYGVDLDSYDVASLIAERDTLATASVSTGPDLVILHAVLLQVKSNIIAGRVFEDVNYGGGAGRGYAAALAAAPTFAVGRPGAQVELYDVSGNYLRTATTDADGDYGFAGLIDGDYFVRAVNRSFSSSRPGATGNEWPVQTYRTDANSGTTIPVADAVGGTAPGSQESGANLTSANLSTLTAQSVTPVRIITGIAVSGTDFGFNFDTIVNANDAGQGSLRQFVTNSNALTNAGLAQEGKVAGRETSVFMMSDGLAHPGLRAGLPSQLTGGVGVITLTSALPALADPGTTLDGTTQTTNVGNTNPAVLGQGGSVGVDSLALVQVPGPEIEIVDGAANLSLGLDVSANDTTVRGVSIWGFGTAMFNNGHGTVRVNSGTGALFERNVIGARATSFTDPGASRTVGQNVWVFGGTGTIRENLIGFAAGSGLDLNAGSGAWTVAGNELRGNGITCSFCEGLVGLTTGHTISGNLVAANRGSGVDFYNSTSSLLFENNTVTRNGIADPSNETAGIRVGSGSGARIERNVSTANYGAGVMVADGASGAKISRNSIFLNGTILNEASGAASGQIGIDLLSAADSQSRGTAPYVTLNDSGDGDSGGNALLNYPVIESAVVAGPTLTVSGFASPGSTIEFFLADPDPSGFGEGDPYLFTAVEGSGADLDPGTGTYGPGPVNGRVQGTDTTNRFQFVVPTPPGVLAGSELTATATDGSNSTSEFSGLVVVIAPSIVKRAFTIDGTPIADASTAPKGTLVKFLLYVNGDGAQLTDVSIADVLEPGFLYVAGSIRYAGTSPSCAATACTPAEEAAIFAVANAGAVGTDAVNADVVSFGGNTVRAGNQAVANAQLDIATGRTWAMVFTVRMQ